MKLKDMPWSSYWKTKFIEPEKIEAAIQDLRRQNKTIATINGSFDLMHAGHLHILFEASKVADILIVALNSDASIKQYKSPSRPIISLNDRLQMIAALGFVDYVTSFEEVDPRALLEKIKPDVHVNGVEYGDNCIEAEVVKKHGGKLHLVDRVEGLATSEIIKKIQAL